VNHTAGRLIGESEATAAFSAGYIFLYRRLLENPLWHQLPAEWLKVWIGILLRANFKPTKWWDGKQQIDIPAGAFVTSIEKLAGFCKVTPKQIRGTLNYLERAGMVARRRAGTYSVLVVENWDTYQKPGQGEGIDEGAPDGKDRAYTRAQSGHDRGTIGATEEECKKERREETRSGFGAESAFQKLWDTYPKKGRVDFTLSQTYFCEEILNQQTFDKALASISPGGKFAISEKWEKGFIKAFPAWIHNRAWETEDPEPAEKYRTAPAPQQTVSSSGTNPNAIWRPSWLNEAGNE
jgi:hypothetical protein